MHNLHVLAAATNVNRANSTGSDKAAQVSGNAVSINNAYSL